MVFSGVKLSINEHNALNAMRKMWGDTYPKCDGGVAGKAVRGGSQFGGVGGLDALKKRRIGDRFRYARLLAYQSRKPTTLASTGELGEFAGRSEMKCALFCDPARITIEAI